VAWRIRHGQHNKKRAFLLDEITEGDRNYAAEQASPRKNRRKKGCKKRPKSLRERKRALPEGLDLIVLIKKSFTKNNYENCAQHRLHICGRVSHHVDGLRQTSPNATRLVSAAPTTLEQVLATKTIR